MATEQELRLMRDMIRKVKVRALQDKECTTHFLSKGRVHELDSDIAADLIEAGVVELASEPVKQQATLPTQRAEKRG